MGNRRQRAYSAAMAVLIDPPLWPAHGRRWSHLASDHSLRELHTFAAGVGLPERGFEGDHYDVPEDRYADTVAAGAMPVSSRELLRRLQGSGLRRPKRRGERVLVSRQDAQGPGRVDALLSGLPPVGPVTAVHLVVVAGRELLVLPDDVGYRLPGQQLDPAGEAPLAAARGLVAALVGGVVPAGADTGSQVGYLRRVIGAAPGGAVGAVADNEVVVRFLLVGSRPRPAGGAVWVLAYEAVALLSGPVAALAAGGAYRSPDRPGPLPGRLPGRLARRQGPDPTAQS